MEKNLLVIEDSTVAMLIVTFIIELYNPQRFHVTHCKALQEGFDSIASVQPDLIILDLTLLDSSYEKTLKYIGMLTKFAPVIVVSSHLLRDESLKAGASAFIHKSSLTLENKDEIMATVQRVLDARPGYEKSA